MKRLIFVLILCFIASPAVAGSMIISGSGGGGGECASYDDIADVYGDTDDNDAVASGTNWLATQVSLTSGDEIRRYLVRARDIGSDTGSLEVLLMPDSSGDPDDANPVANSSATLAASSIADGAIEDVNVDLAATLEITSTATYWIVFRSTGGGTFQIGYDTTEGVSDRTEDSGSTWRGTNWVRYFRSKVQGCPN